jgi:hypothetical protein
MFLYGMARPADNSPPICRARSVRFSRRAFLRRPDSVRVEAEEVARFSLVRERRVLSGDRRSGLSHLGAHLGGFL